MNFRVSAVLLALGLFSSLVVSAQSNRVENEATVAQQMQAERFVSSCHQAVDSGGKIDPACRGTIYQNELQRLRMDALHTRNPALITLIGDAYSSPLSPDVSAATAYQWYLMAAVRGDPQAIQRLASMYHRGQGVPRDRVRAFGYARVATRLALPGSQESAEAERVLSDLGRQMSAEEIELAERFALQMQGQLPAAGQVSDSTTPRPKEVLERDTQSSAASAVGWTGPLIHALSGTGVPPGGAIVPGVGRLTRTTTANQIIDPATVIGRRLPGMQSIIPESGVELLPKIDKDGESDVSEPNSQ